ncbi:hypothetical protein CRUP_029004, partial [Coryphaenoides rupestris]
PPLRAALESLLRPDPGRAAHLRAQFQQGFRGIAGRLWSRINLVLAVDSGSNQIYGEMLRDHYCQGSEQQVEIEGISLTGRLPEGKDRSLTVPRSGLLPGVTWVSPGNLESEPPVE